MRNYFNRGSRSLRRGLFFLILFAFSCLSNVYSLTFEIPAEARSLCTMDIDLDGDMDIVTGHCYDPDDVDTITVMINQGDMEFNRYYMTADYKHWSMCCGNFDDDDYPDFITGGRVDQTIQFYRNNSEGSFDDPVVISNSYGATSLITTDFENDGDLDAFFLNSYYGCLGFLVNDGLGNFSTQLVTDCSMMDNYLQVKDLNGDNFPDVMLGWYIYINHLDWIEEVSVNTGGAPVYSADLGDFDNDNDYDLYYLCAGYPGFLRIYANDGNANFTYSSDFYLPSYYYFYVFINAYDINSDGYDDTIYLENLWGEGYNLYVVLNDETNSFDEYDFHHFDSLEGYWEDPGNIHFVDIDDDNDKDLILYSLFPYPYPRLVDFLIILFNDGTGKFSENYVSIDDELPDDMPDYLLVNYPNPFNNRTTIHYSVNESGIVDLSIYDIRGRVVKELISDKMVSRRNTYTVDWDGKDKNNRTRCSGIYMINLKVNGNSREIRKLIFLNKNKHRR